MKYGAQLNFYPGRGWYGLVFIMGNPGGLMYRTEYYNDRATAKDCVDGFLIERGIKAQWLSDSRPIDG